MSRYIDADALKRKVLEWMPPNPCGREEKEHSFETDIVVSLMMEIEEAPTIDINRPKGKWKYGNGNGECPFCSHERQDGWDNFCGFCGADMRGSKK